MGYLVTALPMDNAINTIKFYEPENCIVIGIRFPFIFQTNTFELFDTLHILWSLIHTSRTTITIEIYLLSYSVQAVGHSDGDESNGTNKKEKKRMDEHLLILLN